MYKLKIKYDMNLPFRDDPTARAKAELLIAQIEGLIDKVCNTPRPIVERVTLIDEDRRDGFNLLSKMNDGIQASR